MKKKQLMLIGIGTLSALVVWAAVIIIFITESTGQKTEDVSSSQEIIIESNSQDTIIRNEEQQEEEVAVETDVNDDFSPEDGLSKKEVASILKGEIISIDTLLQALELN